jgi:hypothetical protein
MQTDMVSADQDGFGGIQRREIARNTWMPHAWATEGVEAKFITSTVAMSDKNAARGSPELFDALVEEQQEHGDEFLRVNTPVCVIHTKSPYNHCTSVRAPTVPVTMMHNSCTHVWIMGLCVTGFLRDKASFA